MRSTAWHLGAALVMVLAVGGCSGSAPTATGYTSQRTRLTTVTDNTAEDDWGIDTSKPAVLEQGSYDGDVVGVTLTLYVKTKLPHDNWVSYAKATATITETNGTIIKCSDTGNKKRAGTVFEPDHIIEVDCYSFTADASSTVKVMSG